MFRTRRTRGSALTVGIVITLVIGAVALMLRNAGAPNVAVLKKKNGGSSTLSFSAHPTVTAPGEPENILGNTSQVGYGVDFATGQFRYLARGLHFAGISGHGDRDMTLRLDLLYRSHGSTNGYFGRNWHFPYFQWVEERTVGQDTVLDYYDGTGRVDTFSNYNASTHKWDTNPTGYFGAFVESTDSPYDWDRYTYTDVDGFKRTFDDDGRLYRMTDRNGNYIEAVWGSGSNKFKLTDIRDTTYDGSSRVIQLSYYSTNRVQTLTDYGNGVATRTITLYYNGNDELEKFETPKPSSSASTTPFESFVYDANHNLTQIKHPLSGGTTWLTNTYDSNNPARVKEQDLGGETFKICYLSSPTRTAVLDGNAHLVEYHVPGSAPTNVPSKKVEHTGTWTHSASPCSFTFNSGSKTRSSDPDNYTTEYTWNTHGQLTNAKYPRGNATKYKRDDSARPWAVTSVVRKKNDSDQDGDSDNVVTTYTYAGNYNQVKTVVEPKGSSYTTTFYYDFEEATLGDLNGDSVTNGNTGNLVKVKDPDVSVPVTQNDNYQTFTHNARGQVVNHLRNRSDGTFSQITTRYAYYTSTGSGALKDFVQSVSENYGGSDTIVTTYKYNNVGLVTAVVDPRNTNWEHKTDWDDRDRVTKKTSPLGADYTVAYSYNDWDLRTQMDVKNVASGVVTSNSEWTTIWTYNNNRRLPTKEEIEVSTDTYKATNFTYDPHFNRQDVEDPNGNKVRTVYDERNLIFKITRGYNASTTLQSPTQYDYDGNRNRTTITDARNNTRLFEYDLFERPTKETNEVNCYRMHTYDKNGNREQTKHYDSSDNPKARSEWLYDQRNRRYLTRSFKSDTTNDYITAETRYDRDSNVIEHRGPTCGGSCPDTSRTYDAFSRVTKVEDRDGNHTDYLYDEAGNVTTIKEYEKDGTSTYIYETVQGFGRCPGTC